MIVYAFFMILLFVGFSFFAYGLMLEYQFYVSLAVSLGLPQVPIPIGFYVIIASIMFFIATPIIILIRIKQTGCGKRFDATPKGKGLFDFIYRDGDVRDVYGDRIPGLGLFRIPKLGLIFDTGREPRPGSVYNIPGKKVRFALQDINFAPNAKIAGFYPYLTDLGFNNMTEVQDVLNGHNPELMVKVWNILCNQEEKTPVDHIVERIQTLSKDDVEHNNRLWGRSVKRKKWKKQKSVMMFKPQQTERQPITPMGIINKAIEKPGRTDYSLDKIQDDIDKKVNK
jgi:hypothetical protein